jgi:hypothetical protein
MVFILNGTRMNNMQIGEYKYMLLNDMSKLQNENFEEFKPMFDTFKRVFTGLAQVFVSEGDIADWLDEIIKEEAQIAFENETNAQTWGSEVISGSGQEIDLEVRDFFREIAENEGEDHESAEYIEAIQYWFYPALESEILKSVHRQVIKLQLQQWEQRFGNKDEGEK